MNTPVSTAKSPPGMLGSTVILLFGLALVAHASSSLYNTYQSPWFVEIPAHVLDTDTYSSTSGSRNTTYGTWHYQYEFEGKTYEDSARQYGQYLERMQQYPQGSTMPIYINPSFPTRSQLHNDRSWGSIVLFLGEWLVGGGIVFGWTLLLADRLRPARAAPNQSKTAPGIRTDQHVTHSGAREHTTCYSWDDALIEPQTVEVLYLNDQGLSSLAPDISRMSALRELYLSGNQLTDLPDELATLSTLQVLNVSRNALTRIPAPAYQLVNLRCLDASHNHITTFRFPSSPLKQLTTLSLAGNSLSVLDLPRACPLEHIDLSETSFPETETALLKQRFKQANISVSLTREDQAIADEKRTREEVKARTQALEQEVEAKRVQAEQERQQALDAAQAQAQAAMARIALETAAQQAALQAEFERVEREQAALRTHRNQHDTKQQAAMETTTKSLEEEVQMRIQAMDSTNAGDRRGDG